MSNSQHSPLKVFLLAAASFTFLMSSNYSVFAADCGGYVSQCITQNAGKSDAKVKCSAAGQSCAKTGTFVGPFNGQSYQVRACGAYNRGQACY
jgi:hypothetical protein